MPDIVLLARDEWDRLRDIRLSALSESPDAFLSTYDREMKYDEARWRAEFLRGEWIIGLLKGRPVSLLGATREPGAPDHERYLEYLWVSPVCRHSGIARRMLTIVINRLKASGVKTVFLWVLDGNEAAMNLYKGIGFVSTNHRQPLPEQPERTEERLRLDMSAWPGHWASC